MYHRHPWRTLSGNLAQNQNRSIWDCAYMLAEAIRIAKTPVSNSLKQVIKIVHAKLIAQLVVLVRAMTAIKQPLLLRQPQQGLQHNPQQPQRQSPPQHAQRQKIRSWSSIHMTL